MDTFFQTGPGFNAGTDPGSDPGTGDWRAWRALLQSRIHDPDAGPMGAMCLITDEGFETVSSSLIALPDPTHAPSHPPVWLFAPGRPDQTRYKKLDL